MFTTNPFSILSQSIPLIAVQSFVLIMVGLVILGTVLDMIHKKNVKYFFNNAKKAKKNAKREIGGGERIAVIAKTIKPKSNTLIASVQNNISYHDVNPIKEISGTRNAFYIAISCNSPIV